MEEFDNALKIRHINNKKRDEIIKWQNKEEKEEGFLDSQMPTNYLFISPASKLIAIHKKMLFMIDYENENGKELEDINKFLVNYFGNETYENTDNINDKNYTDVFYKISKKIYDNHTE